MILTDKSNLSSNLTVAAEWNTIDTFRHKIFWKKIIKTKSAKSSYVRETHYEKSMNIVAFGVKNKVF